MKLKIDRDWIRQKTLEEGGHEIGAGSYSHPLRQPEMIMKLQAAIDKLKFLQPGLENSNSGAEDAMVDFLPDLIKLLEQTASQPTPERGEVASSVDFHQRRGRDADIIEQALESYREFMLDDAHGMEPIHDIFEKMQSRFDMVDRTALGGGWRDDMENAPRDGTRVLLSHGRPVKNAPRHAYIGKYLSEHDQWLLDSGTPLGTDKFRCWMPLPPLTREEG